MAHALQTLAPTIEDATEAGARQEIADYIAGVARSLGDMVKLMTVVAEVEAGRVAGVRRSIEIETVVCEVLAEVAPLLIVRKCEFEGRPVAGAVLSDGALVQALVHGLVLTAVKLRTGRAIVLASWVGQAGGPVSSVQVSSVQVSSGPRSNGGQQIALEITYEGMDPTPGLTTAAFVDLAAVASDPGKPFVGLGLALAARLAQRLGGELEVGPAAGGSGCGVARSSSQRWRLVLWLPAARE